MNKDIIKTQCCCCGAFKKDEQWDGVRRPIIRDRIDISHGYCPLCFIFEKIKIIHGR